MECEGVHSDEMRGSSGTTATTTTTTTATATSGGADVLRALRMRTMQLENALGYQVYTASVLARELESRKMRVTTLEAENAHLRERLAAVLHASYAPARVRRAVEPRPTCDGSAKRRRHDDSGAVDSQTELDVAMLLGSLASIPGPSGPSVESAPTSATANEMSRVPVPTPPTPPPPPPPYAAVICPAEEPTTPQRRGSAASTGTPPRSASSKPVYLMRPLPLSGTPTARMLVTPMSLPLTLPLFPVPPMPSMPMPPTSTFGDISA